MNEFLDIGRLSKEYVPETEFFYKIAETPIIISDAWHTDLTLEDVQKILTEDHPRITSSFRDLQGDYYKVTYIHTKFRLSITFKESTLYVGVASARDHDGKAEIDKLRELIPESDYADEDTLQVKFYYGTAGGYSELDRKLQMKTWEEIAPNYTDAVRTQIEGLTKLTKDDITAKLILWYGNPGTGKSTAIHALAWEWRNWCRFELITDSDQFFNNPNYMLRVLLKGAGQPSGDFAGTPATLEGDYYDESDILYQAAQKRTNKPEWRILVLEDAGELIATDAKLQSGSQALSRLLNMIDGFIGQGLKVMLLITTNEEIGKLNAAVTRSGRVLAQTRFNNLSVDEANTWLKAQGVDKAVKYETSLADLFRMLREPDYLPKATMQKFGL